jgi:hypothetical protein
LTLKFERTTLFELAADDIRYTYFLNEIGKAEHMKLNDRTAAKEKKGKFC